MCAEAGLCEVVQRGAQAPRLHSVAGALSRPIRATSLAGRLRLPSPLHYMQAGRLPPALVVAAIVVYATICVGLRL